MSCITCVYYVYNQSGPSYVGSGILPGSDPFWTEYVNLLNCNTYDIYMFGVPWWEDGSYSAGDIVTWTDDPEFMFYVALTDTIGNPSSAPADWQRIYPTDEDFQSFWSLVLSPEYENNVIPVRQQITATCLANRIPNEIMLDQLDCDNLHMNLLNKYAEATPDVRYYAFLFDAEDNIILPTTYDLETGEFEFDPYRCGDYVIRQYAVPLWTAHGEACPSAYCGYFAGAIVYHLGHLYMANVDNMAEPGFGAEWQKLTTGLPDAYNASTNALLVPILSDCYLGDNGLVNAGFSELSVSCDCALRYNIDVATTVTYEPRSAAFQVTTTGGYQDCWRAALFLLSEESGYFFSYIMDPSGSYVAQIPSAVYNGCIVCVAPCWYPKEAVGEPPVCQYTTGSIVWHNDQFWRAVATTCLEPGGEMVEDWVPLGITSEDFNNYWVGDLPQSPYNVQVFDLTVDCPTRKLPTAEISADYSYTCSSRLVNYSYASSFDCYAAVALVYSDSAYVGDYYIPAESASQGSFSIGELEDANYQIETYVIPCHVMYEYYDIGEIVCYDGKLYISQGTDQTPGGSGWHEITNSERKDTVSTIKSTEYMGQANYVLTNFQVDCLYTPIVEYAMTLEKECADLSLSVFYNPIQSGNNFRFACWMFDAANVGKPAAEIVMGDLTQVVPDAWSYDQSVIFEGLENGHSYVVASVGIPEFRHGHQYERHDLTWYGGLFWEAIADTTDIPGSTDSWQTMDDYLTQWNTVLIGTAYSTRLGYVEFDCKPKVDTDKLDFSHSSVNSEDASFALIRTNPALTGNITLTVDKTGDLWFNSIDANEEISKDQYKHYPVDSTVRHPANVFNFFDKGKTQFDIIFDVHADVAPTVMTGRYEDQFDFSFYYSGVKYMKSKYYDEKFTYFAPLYLKKVIPEYFVIFKIDDPLNAPIDQLKSYDYNQTDYMYELLKRATLIKSFNLSEQTKLGKYLRGMITDPFFPASPLSVNFSEDGMTTWNGASIATGTWNQKGELLSSMYKNDDALKYFEEYVTLGYRRHGILFPNIVNIEFLFDDETSEIFDFNRYIGFYVNAVQLEKFDLDVARYNSQQESLGNSPVFMDMVDDCSDEARLVTNASGVKIPYSHSDAELDYRDFGLMRDKMFVNYVKDKDDVLHGVSMTDPYSGIMTTDSPQRYSVETIRLADRGFDISKLFGTDAIFIQDRGMSAPADGVATSYIKFLGALNNYDVIRIYHDAGSNADADGRFDDINVFSQQSSPSYLPNPGEYYHYAVPVGSPADPNSYYVNGMTLHESVYPVVTAVYNCIDIFPNRTFEATVVQDCLFLMSYASSLANGEYGIKFISNYADNYDNVEIGGLTGDALRGKVIRFSGGTDKPNRLVIDAKHKDMIIANQPELRVRTVNGWSRIIGVANYTDTISVDSLTSQSAIENAYSDYFGKIVLTLEKDEKPDISDGGFLIKTAAHAEFGMLSFFNVKDFDGDFYSSKYNRYPVWEYYKHLSIPAGMDLLTPGVEYEIKGSGSVIYNGVIYNTGSVFTAIDGVFMYSITSGSPTVVYSKSQLPGILSSIFLDGNSDMSSFDGFMAIRDERNRVSEFSKDLTDLSEYYLRFTSDIIRSEYDYYRENFTKDFAFKSKILPYISKWGYINGKDARDNEYRLNNHTFFGEYNFSPSHVHDIQDETHLTHEWYYIVASYPFIKERSVLLQNYCYFEEDIDLSRMTTVENEFERYFTYVPMMDMDGTWKEISKTQARYSTLRYNPVVGCCETFFRGAKLVMKDVLRDSDGNAIIDPVSKKPKWTDSRRFDGYKFSAILRPVQEDLNDTTQSPIRMRFVCQDDLKFVLLLIEIAVGYAGNVGAFKLPVTRFYSGVLGVDENTSIDTIYNNPPRYRVDGDYRISFDGSVSDLTYSFLYGAKNKKFYNAKDCFSSIRIPTLFSLFGFTIDREFNKVKSYCNYDSNLLTELTEYGGSIDQPPYVVAAEYFGQTVFNEYPTSVTQNSLVTSSNAFRFDMNSMMFPPAFDKFSAYKQVAGGRKYYEKLLKKISFASIFNYVNEMGPYKDKLDGFVEYETYGSTAAPVQTFYAEITPPASIGKTHAIVPDIESNVPDKFRQVREIGFEFKKGALQNEYMIYRHQGGYEPVFRNVITFTSRYDFDYNPSMRTVYIANTVFATEADGFGILKNFCHMKVSDKKILSLQDDTKFYPAYELLNEITIGRADFHALHSSWDYGFHKYYTSKDRFSNVAGSLRVAEDYTYFSKVLNLPFDTYLLDYAKDVPQMDYDAKVNYEPVLVDDINSIDMEKYCVVYTRTAKTNGANAASVSGANDEWTGYINLRNAMIHKFKHGGISAKFVEFLAPTDAAATKEFTGFTDIDDYVTAYLSENVYDLYDITESYFYMQPDTMNMDVFAIEYNDYSTLTNSNWSLLKDVKINKYSKHVLSFNFVKPLNSGALLSPVIKIRLI